MKFVDQNLIKSFALGNLKVNSHKYNWGYTLIIAGSKNMLGAALMAAESALECGSGVVVVATTENQVNYVMNYRPELMAIAYEDSNLLQKHLQKATAICIGPGLVENDTLLRVLKELVLSEIPLVIDATALKLLKVLLEENYQISNRNIIITPHHGEFYKLSNGDVKENLNYIAEEFRQKYPNITLVLKGAPTIIYGQDEIYNNGFINPKFASAGMGDVLAGIIAGLASYHQPMVEAVIAGVYIHSEVAEKISKSKHKVNATNVIREINQEIFLINN